MVRSIERAVFALALAAVAILLAFAGPEPSRADHFACHAPNRGWGFDTYEYEDYVGQYNKAIDLAVRGWAVPPAYTIGDETVNVSYQGVESGPRGSRSAATPSNGIPPTVYKSIAWIESGWSHGAGSVPYGGTGPVITAMDCGYGIGQITTGMGHLGGGALEPRVPAARQAIIGTHPLFNIAEGVRILADKWNSAPNFRPIAGQGDPAVFEDWYYAIWSYNGFAFVNHPLNPSKDPLRGSVWNCGDPNAPGYGFYDWGDYTYPEKVYGCLRYPPVPKGQSYPPPLPGSGSNNPPPSSTIAVGDAVTVIGTGGDGLNIRASAGTGAQILATVPQGTALTVVGGPASANGFTWWNVQTAGGVSGWAAGQFLAKPAPEPGPDAPVNPAGRMWPPQVFSMPNLASPEIATAMTTAAFSTCEDNGFSGGCPAMDFSTVPHYDTSPPGNPSDAAYFLGDPVLQVEGPRTVSLAVSNGTSTSSPVTVKNVGSGIGPFRVRTDADWLIVRHPYEGGLRHVDGGVALGSDIQVVTQRSPRQATAGRDSVLQITVDPTFLKAGSYTGTVIIDTLLGTGAPATFNVSISVTGGAGGGPGPSPTPTQTPPTYKAIVPNLTSEGSH